MADVLCLGGTGTVGSRVVDGLVARGASVRCMTRSESVAGTEDGDLAFVLGDLSEPDSLTSVFEGVSRVHLLTPLHPNEADLGRNAIAAAQTAGVERIVFHSVHNAEGAPHIPHFGSKVEILDALLASGIPWTTIEPNHYFQNDLWIEEALHAGVYPLPIGPVGLNRVDVRDIADATINALLDDGHEGLRVPLIGPYALTGEDVARIWSEALGHDVMYTGDDLDAWQAAMTGALPDWMLQDLRMMSEHFLQHGLVASEQDFASMSHALGHAPRMFDDFAREMATAWASD